MLERYYELLADLPEYIFRPPTMAVLVAASDEARRLSDTLGSICEQWVIPDRLILLDDGSTDDTRTIMDVCRHPGKRVLTSATPQGTVEAYASMMGSVDTDYLMLAGGHDDFLPGCWADLANAARKFPAAGMIVGDAQGAVAHARNGSMLVSAHEYLASVMDPAADGVCGYAVMWRRDAYTPEDPEMGHLADWFAVQTHAMRNGYVLAPVRVLHRHVDKPGMSERGRDKMQLLAACQRMAEVLSTPRYADVREAWLESALLAPSGRTAGMVRHLLEPWDADCTPVGVMPDGSPIGE